MGFSNPGVREAGLLELGPGHYFSKSKSKYFHAGSISKSIKIVKGLGQKRSKSVEIQWPQVKARARVGLLID